MLFMNAAKPWLRTQEMHFVTLAPDVLATASRKLLQRLHFIGDGSGGLEGHGQEPAFLRGMRQELEAGRYERIRELSPRSTKEELTRAYTFRGTSTGRRAALNQPERRYPAAALAPSDDPLEVDGQVVDARHRVLLEATRERARAFAQAAVQSGKL